MLPVNILTTGIKKRSRSDQGINTQMLKVSRGQHCKLMKSRDEEVKDDQTTVANSSTFELHFTVHN